jgi:two-component system sensor histidine kinase BaeS
MIPKSIRWRLPLSYAAIALLAAVSLGVVLLTTLRGYYVQRELDYLHSNAQAIGQGMLHLLRQDPSPEAIQARLRSFSFLSQTRVRLLDEAGQVIFDSFNLQEKVGLAYVGRPVFNVEGDVEIQQLSLTEQVEENDWMVLVLKDASEQTALTHTAVISANETGSNMHTTAPLSSTDWVQTGLPDPFFFNAVGTPYGFDLNTEATMEGQRSDQSVRHGFFDTEGNFGYIELSEGPTYGRQVLNSVAQGWVIASGVAVFLAAGVGWLVSRQISTPLLALTEVTTAMAKGNLSARADVTRQDELGLLGRSFNGMAEQVEETVAALRRFVADAAHELHTPLTALRTNLELAANEQNKTDQFAFVDRAQTQARRLEVLTKDLLELSCLEAGNTKDQTGLLDWSSLIQATSEPYASQAEQACLTFTLNLPAEVVTLEGNEIQLRRMLSNLLDNALKFTPEGGAVHVSLILQQDWAELQVADTGIGIPAEDLPQLFSRFHRARNASAYPGSGLGLAIVQTIVEGHSGKVRAESAKQGTKVSVRLPIMRSGNLR